MRYGRIDLTLKCHPCGFSKNVSSKERVKLWFFVTFHIIMNHIFSENFIEIPQVVQKLWRFSPSILAIFINFHQFSRFFTFLCYKETNDVSLEQTMSVFFHFQHTLKRLFNNCIKLYWYLISSSWNKQHMVMKFILIFLV